MAFDPKDVESSIVFVFKQPEVVPLNPFDLMDVGLFTRDEVRKGSMDFGPGYLLQSQKGYRFLREVNRMQLSFAREASGDFQLIMHSAKRLVETVKFSIVAMGINFMYMGARELSTPMVDSLMSVSRVMNPMKNATPGYSCFYNDGDIMCTINILSRRIKTESKISAVYDVSINNHIRCSEDSLLAQLERVQPLKQNFESLLGKVIK